MSYLLDCRKAAGWQDGRADGRAWLLGVRPKTPGTPGHSELAVADASARTVGLSQPRPVAPGDVCDAAARATAPGLLQARPAGTLETPAETPVAGREASPRLLLPPPSPPQRAVVPFGT